MPDFGDDRVMAATQRDLERWFRDFTGMQHLGFQAGKMAFTHDGVDLTVRLDPMPPRRLGLITFIDNRVRFEYPPEQAAAVRQWITRFDHYTQRGGG